MLKLETKLPQTVSGSYRFRISIAQQQCESVRVYEGAIIERDPLKRVRVIVVSYGVHGRRLKACSAISRMVAGQSTYAVTTFRLLLVGFSSPSCLGRNKQVVGVAWQQMNWEPGHS